jgi:hypothetical protein
VTELGQLVPRRARLVEQQHLIDPVLEIHQGFQIVPGG